MKKVLVLFMVVLLAATSLAGCKKEETTTFDGKNVRVVIGSTSTTGDSYMIADMAMRYLSKALNANTKVDAVGAGPAFETLAKADPDGNTIMMFHDMTYLGISFGAFDEQYGLENMVIGPRIGLNPGGCFAASADAPYDDMKEMADYLAANPDEIVRAAVEAGGVSHIGFISYYEWVVEAYGQDVADRIVVVVGGSTAEKSQMLWDGNTDIIFADYSSLLQYTEEGVEDQLKMKFVALLDKIDGTDIPTFADLGVTLNGAPFAFSKEFIIYLPKETPQAFVDELDQAALEISKDQAFIDDMAKQKYKVAYLPSADTKTHIMAKRDSLDALIKAAPSLDVLTVQ
ncbi:tripartite tricarboxylate transporter substrate-binding protein [Petrocella sp. FN5]|uniref:tripartite tricarboxylate transporter substrate-binding protein n=1 Tax=Petrocella sp. FN5 TaxID=3032002 RepID=UPI0023DC4DAA|nr:tripartite tricarboxylate transporter substrate-binding protein [Petrocella sp. FN5]MDF1616754.1 tripartite tricarboxylate transporter substrate-binding protein [Petrocella sp. FN5]